MKTARYKAVHVKAVIALLFAFSVGLCRSDSSAQVGRPLTTAELTQINASLSLMRTAGLGTQANDGQKLLQLGMWRAASPDDAYIAEAQKAGGTPYAYTLSPGHQPTAIVLADRFFTETTPLGRAAVMIHEIGHYKAYVKSGRSDEYDGYKAEYDTYPQLGLSEKDGLVYFAMLDGTAEYVVPRDKSYAKRPDLQQFLTN